MSLLAQSPPVSDILPIRLFALFILAARTVAYAWWRRNTRR